MAGGWRAAAHLQRRRVRLLPHQQIAGALEAVACHARLLLLGEALENDLDELGPRLLEVAQLFACLPELFLETGDLGLELFDPAGTECRRQARGAAGVQLGCSRESAGRQTPG